MQKNIFKLKEFILVDILMLIEFTNNDLVEQLCNLVTSKFLKIKKGNCYVYILFKNRQIPQKSTSQAFDFFIKELGVNSVEFINKLGKKEGIKVYIENSINFLISYKKKSLKLNDIQKKYFNNAKYELKNYQYYYYPSSVKDKRLNTYISFNKPKSYLKFDLFDYASLTNSLVVLNAIIKLFNCNNSGAIRLQCLCLINTFYIGLILKCLEESGIGPKAFFTLKYNNLEILYSDFFNSVDDFIEDFINKINPSTNEQFIVQIDFFEYLNYDYDDFDLSESKKIYLLKNKNIKYMFRKNYDCKFIKLLQKNNINTKFYGNYNIYELEGCLKFIDDITKIKHMKCNENEILLYASYLTLLISKKTNKVASEEVLNVKEVKGIYV